MSKYQSHKAYATPLHKVYSRIERSLSSLGALTLENHRLYNDRVTVYKNLHSITNFSPDSLKLFTVTLNSYGCGVRLKQTRAINKSCTALFSHRGSSEWNKLPLAVTKHLTLASFKTALKQYLNCTRPINF